MTISSSLLWQPVTPSRLHHCVCVFQVRAEITSKEKEEEDMMEKVQKEAKYETTLNVTSHSVFTTSTRLKLGFETSGN